MLGTKETRTKAWLNERSRPRQKSVKTKLAKLTMAMVAVEDFVVYSIGGVTTANEVITSDATTASVYW